uniref:Retrotransposon gag domain-containing protein n=1 Tax=Cannabis sativa TaxID=3483 RepID=A0A803P3U2_CANSA
MENWRNVENHRAKQEQRRANPSRRIWEAYRSSRGTTSLRRAFKLEREIPRRSTVHVGNNTQGETLNACNTSTMLGSCANTLYTTDDRSCNALSQDDLAFMPEKSLVSPSRPRGQETTTRPKWTGAFDRLGRQRDLRDTLTKRRLVEARASKGDTYQSIEVLNGTQTTTHDVNRKDFDDLVALLPPRSINSWKDLVDTFDNQFVPSRQHQIEPNNLVDVKQLEDESLKDYIQQFLEATFKTKMLSEDARVMAAVAGLKEISPLWFDLCLKSVYTMNIFLHTADGFIKLEEVVTRAKS